MIGKEGNMKKRGKRLLAAWLTLILTLTMNPAVYADNTDAGETVAVEAESGSDAVAPVAAEAESGA